MCGRVGLGKEQRYAIDQRYDLVLSRLNLQRRYNVPPSLSVPLLYDAQGEAGAVMAKWGLVPFWSRDGKGWSNARGETVHEKPAFRSAFKQRRGVIVVDHFFEWQAMGHKAKKQPWLFTRADEQPMLMAALWEPGDPPTATIVTINANDWMTPIHDRMPVILETEELDRWMLGTQEEARAIIQPGADGVLQRQAVSTLVSTGREDAACIDPITID